MLDVLDRLFERERLERVAHPDALAERRVCVALEANIELRLSDEDHREQVLIVELKIRQQADLVERRLWSGISCASSMISDRLALLLVQLDELRLDLLEQVVADARRRAAQSRGDRVDELRRRDARIDQQDDRPRVADAVDERARKRGLPRADLAGQRAPAPSPRPRTPSRASASLCWALSYRNAGSGVLPNGFALKPKNSSNIDWLPQPRGPLSRPFRRNVRSACRRRSPARSRSRRSPSRRRHRERSSAARRST